MSAIIADSSFGTGRITTQRAGISFLVELTEARLFRSFGYGLLFLVRLKKIQAFEYG
jgi:hypothetical protein